MSFLRLERLEKTYPDGTRAVAGIDFAAEQAEFIVLLGPSGCGKTTTLRMIAGLEIATGGTIWLTGRDITRLRPAQRDIGMVFQFYALYPHLRVRDNIAFPLRACGLAASEVAQRVGAVAAQMGLERLLGLYPRQLSGGDQQKVSLARAMVRRPALFLMDEPLGTLDADQRLAMRELIRAEQLASGVTTIYVTHDQEEAMSLADRVVVMSAGRIRQVGNPDEVYDRPADRFVADFVGSPGMNFIPCTVAGINGELQLVSERGQLRLDVPLEAITRAPTTPSATLGIRSEHVHEDDDGPIVGRVLTEEYLGSARMLHVDTACGRLVLRAAARTSRALGSELRLRLDSSRVSVFDGVTEVRL
ncbi:MAG TPA: ABC transporter ATP-binding protein [Polyangiaceae bacterium]|nr:ABC transporter ATP-binding protein [Polyangiaceae bacterium]